MRVGDQVYYQDDRRHIYTIYRIEGEWCFLNYNGEDFPYRYALRDFTLVYPRQEEPEPPVDVVELNDEITDDGPEEITIFVGIGRSSVHGRLNTFCNLNEEAFNAMRRNSGQVIKQMKVRVQI